MLLTLHDKEFRRDRAGANVSDNFVLDLSAGIDGINTVESYFFDFGISFRLDGRVSRMSG